MSETLTYGSVRGVPGDRHPYRDPVFQDARHGFLSPYGLGPAGLANSESYLGPSCCRTSTMP